MSSQKLKSGSPVPLCHHTMVVSPSALVLTSSPSLASLPGEPPPHAARVPIASAVEPRAAAVLLNLFFFIVFSSSSSSHGSFRAAAKQKERKIRSCARKNRYHLRYARSDMLSRPTNNASESMHARTGGAGRGCPANQPRGNFAAGPSQRRALASSDHCPYGS